MRRRIWGVLHEIGHPGIKPSKHEKESLLRAAKSWVAVAVKGMHLTKHQFRQKSLECPASQ